MDFTVRVAPAALVQLYSCIYVVLVDLLYLLRGHCMTLDGDNYWFSHVQYFCYRNCDVQEFTRPTVRCELACKHNQGTTDTMCQEIKGRMSKGLRPLRNERELMNESFIASSLLCLLRFLSFSTKHGLSFRLALCLLFCSFLVRGIFFFFFS